MTKREQFKKLVIEAIHGLPYEEAVKKEVGFGCIYTHTKLLNRVKRSLGFQKPYKHILDVMNSKTRIETIEENDWVVDEIDDNSDGTKLIQIIGLPITIGRVMQALAKSQGEWHITIWGNNICKIDDDIDWKLTKENGQEADDDFQDDETIEALLKLLGGEDKR